MVWISTRSGASSSGCHFGYRHWNWSDTQGTSSVNHFGQWGSLLHAVYERAWALPPLREPLSMSIVFAADKLR